MNRYILYCTEAQTKKALELGAPILNYPLISSPYGVPKFESQGIAYILPTAEQLISWLEEKYIDSITIIRLEKGWEHTIIYNGKEECLSYFSSRKEATLAAIDAAFEYLTNNKK